MTITSKREVARILRAEGESLRRHGFANVFSHRFACLLGWVLRPEQCMGCQLEDFLPDEIRAEACPCPHVDQEFWERIDSIPGMPERVSGRFLSVAAELEAGAGVEDSLLATDWELPRIPLGLLSIRALEPGLGPTLRLTPRSTRGTIPGPDSLARLRQTRHADSCNGRSRLRR